MLACSPMQRKFVLALLMQGTRRSNRAAAIEAGYSNVKDGAKVRGFHLARNERVVAALQEEARRRMDGSSIVAADVLIAIMSDPDQPAKERRSAAVALLDRTGFGAQQNINVNKTLTDRTGVAMAAKIAEFAMRLGMDPGVLLGVNAPRVEVRQIDVSPTKE